MLRQGRYKIDDIQCDFKKLTLYGDEVIVSEKYDITISLENDQIREYSELEWFIIEICKNIPFFDDMTQNFYETISKETDFPHRLAVIYIENKKVILDYWSEEMNNQFSIEFSYDDNCWKLINWNGHTVPSDWVP